MKTRSLLALLLMVFATLATPAISWAYRDLDTGEFLTRDPAGFVDGPNLYTYVKQNPWTHFDPEGLQTARQAEADLYRETGDTESLQRILQQNTQFNKDVGTLKASTDAVASLNPVQNAITGATGKSATADQVSKFEQGMAIVGVLAPAEKFLGKLAQELKTLTTLLKGEKSASSATKESEKLVDVYRGVASDHPAYSDALEGKATPQGGHSDPVAHNAGDTQSTFTSWTTDKSVAEQKATTTQDASGTTHGVVLQDKVSSSQLVKSPDVLQESEVLRQGPVTGAKAIPVPNPTTP